MTVRSLSRQRRPELNTGAFSEPESRKRAGEYLATRLRLPGGTEAEFSRHVSQTLDQMTQRERVFLEIEMSERAQSCHSFDADYGPWSGR